MHKSTDIPEAGTGESLGPLIQRLGPLNNKWREATPPDRVLTLWDMGDVLLGHTAKPDDALLWEIQERSYITRNVLRYALIVRRGWDSREELEHLVDELQSYTVFREALPFLKGNRQGIDAKTYQQVLTLVRDPDTRHATEQLKALKGKRIGRRHSKGKAKAAIKDDALVFRRALAALEQQVVITTPVQQASSTWWTALSQLTMAVAMSDAVNEVPPLLKQKAGVAELAEPLTAALEGGRAALAAFRRIVGAEQLMQAANLFHALRDEEALAEWRRSRDANLDLRQR